MASVPFPVGFAGELLTTSNLPWHGTVAAWVQGIVRCVRGGGGRGPEEGDVNLGSIGMKVRFRVWLRVCGGFQVRQEQRAGT